MTNTPAIPPARLEVTEPEGKRYVVEIAKSPFVIGRSTKATPSDLSLVYKRISRCPNCAVVTYADGSFRLEDCGQKRGLFVNGRQITSHELQDGDTIGFGGFADCPTLVFRGGPVEEAGVSLPSVGELLHELDRSHELDPEARSLQHLGLMLKATALLQSQLPLEEVLAQMVDHALLVTDADRGILFQVEKGKPRATLARQQGGRSLPPEKIQASRTALKQALKRKKLVVEDVAHDALQKAHSVAEQQLRSVVALPLLTLAQMRAGDTTFVPGPDDLLGVLYLDSRRPLAFARLGREVLHGLATQAAGVLDNARLVQRELERRRHEHELKIAREIQQALLPQTFPPYPHLQFIGTNRSCLAVGGDYFDVMDLGADRTALVIADVSGKGLGAALVAAMVQGTFAAMTLGHEPTQVFTHVNRFIWEHQEMQRYATLFFAIIDTEGELTYVNAGHLPPLRVRGERAEPVMNAECLPIGLVEEAEFVVRRERLQPGDTLVLYTDGITEAVNTAEEEFGHERLQQTVGRHARASVEDLQAAILAEVEEFSRGAYQADDITVLILRYCGPSGTKQGG